MKTTKKQIITESLTTLINQFKAEGRTYLTSNDINYKTLSKDGSIVTKQLGNVGIYGTSSYDDQVAFKVLTTLAYYGDRNINLGYPLPNVHGSKKLFKIN